MTTKKVLAIHSGKRNEAGACEIYRVSTPFYYLTKQKGWLADWISFTELHQKYEEQAMLKPELGDRFLDELVNSYDMFVFARICIAPREDAYESGKYLIQKMRDAGKKVVYEVDDDYTNEFRHVANGDAVTLARWCDAITVTTPYLASTMETKTGRPTHIVPNVVDPVFWKEPPLTRLSEDKLRIVLSGSKTHYADWKILEGVLQRIAEEHENVRVLLGAFHPDYLRDVKHVEFVPAMIYPQYTQLVKNADIILAPVDPEDKFNNGKSPIKAIEGMAATRLINGVPHGAAVIATDNDVYRLAVTHNRNGLLVPQDVEAWYDAIEKLILDHEFRLKLQRTAWVDAWKRYDLSKQWVKWARAYNKIFEMPSYTKELRYDKPAVETKIINLPNGLAGTPASNYTVLPEAVPVHIQIPA